MPEELALTAPTKKIKAAKVISIVCFVMVLLALLAAVVIDIFTFLETIMAFIGGLIAAAVVFILLFFLMIISIIFIFGIYLLGDKGFWPADAAASVLHQAINDARPTAEQLAIFTTTRIILLVVCLLIFVASIVALSLNKTMIDGKKRAYNKSTVAFSVISLVLSLLGLIVQIGMLAVMALI